MNKITCDTANRICALVVGAPGVGKTSLIRTVYGQSFNSRDRVWVQKEEPAEKVCVISAESGLLSVRDMIAEGIVEGYEVKSFADMSDMYDLLRAPETEARYKWVFLDSLSEISQMCVEQVKTKYSAAASYQMWGEYNDRMTNIIKSYRDMSAFNVVFTCLEQVDKDENSCRFKIPAVAGQIREKLPAYFDLCLYMDRARGDDGVMRSFFRTNEPVGLAKDRSGKLAEIEPPNLLTVRRKILGA